MRNVHLSACLIVALSSATLLAGNANYPSNRAPLKEASFTALPLTSVQPEGWLKDQLQIAAEGLTGHLDEFWPSLVDSGWKGGAGESWERGPYYLDGLVPLAYQLQDERLLKKVDEWIEPILASGREDGWFGPRQNNDRWPLAVALKVLTQYYEATGDERVIELLNDYFENLCRNDPNWPDTEWRGVRANENIITALWLYRRTGDPKLIEISKSIYQKSYNWGNWFDDFPYRGRTFAKGLHYGQTFKNEEGYPLTYGHPTHVVNIAMAVKHPGVFYQISGDEGNKKSSFEGIDKLDQYHGQVGGRFSGDEHLAGCNPSQGTETCAVVEYMFSLENLVAVFGEPALGDRLELLAYNSLPSCTTADYWARQYDQQGNQVMVSYAKRIWTTNHDDSNLYGLEAQFGCCTANMHQGWPKFVSHMWMATADNGLAVIAYGPNKVSAKVADGTEVTIVQKTDYPFQGEIVMTVEPAEAVRFPLHLRVPAWADGMEIAVNGDKVDAEPGSYAVIDRRWQKGDRVALRMPMKVRTERRYNDSVSVLRGPLYFGLKLDQHWNKLQADANEPRAADWEIVTNDPWNFALAIETDDPSAEIEMRPVADVPWKTENAPVVLKVQGRRLPDWTLERNSAAAPPQSPVQSDQPLTELELIPYGSTRLRISEFPLLGQ